MSDPADPGYRREFVDPRRPPEAEMRIGLAGPLTLALAGDLIPSRPVARMRERVPGFAGVLDLLRGADLCCGNLETTIGAIGQFGGHPHCWDGDWPLLSQPAVAADLASIGFRLLARANNHALDWGIEGMRETARHLDEAGVIHAGAGGTPGLARRAVFSELPQGRVGMVSVATTYRPASEAMRPHGATPGRPGVSAIRLRQVDVMTADEMALLRRLRSGEGAGSFKLFGREFEEGAARGYRHEMDPYDLAGFLASVRQGKQSSDLLIAMVHAHETGRDGYPEPPSAFLRDLARAAIEAGADVVSVSGIHHVGPVDIHRGRPVFYGLGNFIWCDLQEFVPAELFDLNRDLLGNALEHPDRATAADLNAVVNADCFAHQEVFETVLPVVRFDGAGLVDVTLHPVDLGYGDPLTTSGIPRLGGPDQASRILHRIRAASAAYGCEHPIEVRDGTGVLRTRDACGMS